MTERPDCRLSKLGMELAIYIRVNKLCGAESANVKVVRAVSRGTAEEEHGAKAQDVVLRSVSGFLREDLIEQREN